jgi:tRNA (cytidine/uridine-2'-O-)-methyltransferase
VLEVVLLEPRIPPNTGNIIRLCANTGARLHLVEPLGFDLDSAKLRRAGLDYHELAVLNVHPSLQAARDALPGRWLAFTAHGRTRFDAIRYRNDDVLLFGPEPTGLPAHVLADFRGEQLLRLPMRAGNRSLNLSNAVAVAVYQAWGQLGFPGATPD